jgi:hypothetical protein
MRIYSLPSSLCNVLLNLMSLNKFELNSQLFILLLVKYNIKYNYES